MKHLTIAGNWKSNKTIRETEEWLKAFSQLSFQNSHWATGRSVILFAPFTALMTLRNGIDKLALPIAVGAQNVSAFDDGAYTGEISSNMLKELVAWVLIGHSERRRYMGESDKDLADKVMRAKAAGISVMYCVADAQMQVPPGVDIVAYEPVWAIGTGKSDTPENANAVCMKIKEKTGIAAVIYGGSVTEKNVGSFVGMPGIDGILPGGASLNAGTFFQLILEASD